VHSKLSHYQNTRVVDNFSLEGGDYCHTQGIGWCDKTNQLVVTCQGDEEANIILYPDYRAQKTDMKQMLVNDADGRKYSHPSAIQITNGILPIAVAEAKGDSSFVYFYSVQNNKIELIDVPPLMHHKHIGAIGFTKVGDITYLLGLGWDSRYVVCWQSNHPNMYNDFEILFKGNIENFFNEKTGNYNSAWLGSIRDDRIFLLASSGSYFNKRKNHLDIWEVDFNGQATQFDKKDRLHVAGVTRGTTKSLFYEGVTLRKGLNDSLFILSAPQDFQRRDSMSVMKYIYEGILESAVF